MWASNSADKLLYFRKTVICTN